MKQSTNYHPAKQGRRFALLAGLATSLLFGSSLVLANPVTQAQSTDGNQGVTLSATGGGQYSIGGVLDVKISFSAKQKDNGFATGQFRQSVVFQGELVDFHGEVICLSIDEDEGRAWIGGIVTQNKSTSPSFTGAIHEPGRDVWFRVVDYGEGGDQADRSTFLGFEGAAGIITSEEYCAEQIWPDGDARTTALSQGNIQVRP